MRSGVLSRYLNVKIRANMQTNIKRPPEERSPALVTHSAVAERGVITILKRANEN